MRCCVQVSAIGDAFLVVNDVSAMKSPGTSVEHVANTALAVMSLAKHVSCRFDYGDGSQVSLHAPEFRVENLQYGPLHGARLRRHLG